MSRKINRAVVAVTFALSAGAVYGSELNEETFNELCWSWDGPPQNITEAICSCMYRKTLATESIAPEDILKIPKDFWRKIPASRPANATEFAVKDIFKTCSAEVFRKINAR